MLANFFLLQPVVQAVPGYTLALDMNSSYLFVTPPRGLALANVSVDPKGILSVGSPVDANKTASNRVGVTTLQLPVTPLTRGLARVVLTYSDGTISAVNYAILPPLATQVALYGAHLVDGTNGSWLPRDYPDPFGRSASVMPYDREDAVRVLDDSRAYNVGLSDDAGAAQNLAHAIKIAYAPSQSEVTAKDDYITFTLVGVKPDVAKPPLRSLQDPDSFQVRMTVYYYCDKVPQCSNATGSGEFPYYFPEQDKCTMPVGGPIWCMTENMANAT